jgi:hypothetical protein
VIVVRTSQLRTTPTYVNKYTPRPRTLAGDPSAPLVTRVLARECLARERRIGISGRVVVDLVAQFARKRIA